MIKLMTRKEAREKLGLSDATFRRKLNELNIQCITEILPNGVESKKITYEDFLNLSEQLNKSTKDIYLDEKTKDLAFYGLKLELVKTQINLENAIKMLKEREDVINYIQKQNEKLEEKKEKILNEFIKLNKKYTEAINKKNFFAKLFEKK